MAVSKAADKAIDANVITMDRRRGDRREEATEANKRTATNPPRPKKKRRRHIDPTTCERDYNNEEIEFMRAMDDYKRDSGRMFPTCSEVLEVIRGLGYFKLTDEQIATLQVDEFEEVEEEVDEADLESEEFAL